MSVITDNSFFVAPRAVPETDVNKPFGEYLKDRISSLEPAFLIDVLGYEMYTDLNNNTEAVSGVWYELINGKAFTDKLGRENYWCGFRSVEFSPIADYVYYNVIRERHTSFTTLGLVQAAQENATPANPNELLASTWNRMVDILWVMDDFIRYNKASYPKYIGLQYVPFTQYGNEDGMYSYSNNKYFQKINTLGI